MPTFTAVALLCLVPAVFAQFWVPRLDLTTTGPLFTAIQDGSTKVEQLVAGFAADPLQTVPLVPEAVLLAAGTCLNTVGQQPPACPCPQREACYGCLARYYVWKVVPDRITDGAPALLPVATKQYCCADAQDVVAAVLVARQSNLSVSVRGGGHWQVTAAVEGHILNKPITSLCCQT